jgi:hypothetical protein
VDQQVSSDLTSKTLQEQIENLDASQAVWTEDATHVGEKCWEDPWEKPYHHGENPWGKWMENDLFS